MQLIISKIVKRGDRYFILSKSGKNIGKKEGYTSREAAEKRLKQIEFFKHQKSKAFMYIDLITGAELAEALKAELPKTGEFIRVRVKSPGQFDEFRVINIDKKRGIKAILGIKVEDGKRRSEVQSFLFDKDKWTTKEAKKWVKDHQSQASVAFDSNKSHLFSTASTIIDLDENSPIRQDLVKANKIQDVDEDLLYLKFVLCHEGINENKDGFLLEEMEKSFSTAVHKDINVEHSKKIIGVITAARLVKQPEDASFASLSKADNFVPHIECEAVVYQYKFPEEAQAIRDRHAEGSLRFSMETWFKKVHCKKCNATFSEVFEYCEHISNRFSAASAEDDARWLIGMIYAGAGVVEKPADKEAKGLTVARVLQDFDIDFMVDILSDMDNLETVLQQIINKFMNDDLINKDIFIDKIINMMERLFGVTIPSETQANNNNNKQAKGGLTVLQFETAEEMTKSEVFKNALAEAVQNELNKADVDTRLRQVQAANEELRNNLAAKDEELTTANEATEKAKKEFEDYKSAQAKKELADNRYNELVEAGVKFPEDEAKLVKAKEKLGAMNEEDYAEHKEFCLTNVIEKAEASVNDNADDDLDEDLSGLRVDTNFASARLDDDIDGLIADVFGDDDNTE